MLVKAARTPIPNPRWHWTCLHKILRTDQRPVIGDQYGNPIELYGNTASKPNQWAQGYLSVNSLIRTGHLRTDDKAVLMRSFLMRKERFDVAYREIVDWIQKVPYRKEVSKVLCSGWNTDAFVTLREGQGNQTRLYSFFSCHREIMQEVELLTLEHQKTDCDKIMQL
ncbi:hypothetical protein RRG08_029425 [Elysia crispata]|uniref:Uncharacterized protein n=1 Tax=Elysia crispata TaxID=231223 RepID=A0AAE1BE39_9GAST|nr:hypothetical protein RRG08_029425 [Elysia crispata]